MRRNANGNAAPCASTVAERASPPALTAIGPPARRAANARNASSAASGNAAEPGGKLNCVDGRARTTTGAASTVGKLGMFGNGGAASGTGGTGPLTTGPADCGGVENAAGAAVSLAGAGLAAARGALGVASAASSTIFDGSLSLVGAAADVDAGGDAAEDAGEDAGAAAFAGGAAGATVGFVTLPGGGNTTGSCAASNLARSRWPASCAASPFRVAASVGTGLAGTRDKLGYGSVIPGGGGRSLAIGPPCSWCHQSIGLSRLSLLS